MTELSRLAVLGAGHVGPVIARLAIRAGYPVAIAASGDPDDIALITELVIPGAQPRWTADAVADADIVVLAIPLHRFLDLDPGLLNGKIDARTAGLVLYVLQTASANLKRTAFEPKLPTTVVLDITAPDRPIGATAWSPQENCEYEDVEKVLREQRRREESTEEEVDNSGESLAKVLLERLGLPEVPFDEPQPV